jgi:hypothetical protein
MSQHLGKPEHRHRLDPDGKMAAPWTTAEVEAERSTSK